MHRLFKAWLVVAAGWIFSSSGASAQILVDGFLNNTKNVFATAGAPDSDLTDVMVDGQDAQRQLSAEALGDFGLDTQVLSSVWVIDGAPQNGGAGSANAEVEYLGYSLDLGSNTFFAMTLGKVVGSPIAGFIFENGANQLTGAAQLTPTNSGYTVFIDLTSLSGFTPQFTTGVDGITVFIVGETNPFFAEVESLTFTAVPEPSAALLAGLGLAAVWFYRRRGAKNAPR